MGIQTRGESDQSQRVAAQVTRDDTCSEGTQRQHVLGDWPCGITAGEELKMISKTGTNQIVINCDSWHGIQREDQEASLGQVQVHMSTRDPGDILTAVLWGPFVGELRTRECTEQVRAVRAQHSLAYFVLQALRLQKTSWIPSTVQI